jgi:hypothetical protein
LLGDLITKTTRMFLVGRRMFSAVGALELTAVVGAHDRAQFGHVDGLDEGEHFHAAAGRRHLDIAPEPVDDFPGPSLDLAGAWITAGVEVYAEEPEIAALSEFDADSAAGAVDDGVGYRDGLIVWHPG